MSAHSSWGSFLERVASTCLPTSSKITGLDSRFIISMDVSCVLARSSSTWDSTTESHGSVHSSSHTVARSRPRHKEDKSKSRGSTQTPGPGPRQSCSPHLRDTEGTGSIYEVWASSLSAQVGN